MTILTNEETEHLKCSLLPMIISLRETIRYDENLKKGFSEEYEFDETFEFYKEHLEYEQFKKNQPERIKLRFYKKLYNRLKISTIYILDNTSTLTLKHSTMIKLTTEEIFDLECAIMAQIETIEEYIKEHENGETCEKCEECQQCKCEGYEIAIKEIKSLKRLVNLIRKSTGIILETNLNTISIAN